VISGTPATKIVPLSKRSFHYGLIVLACLLVVVPAIYAIIFTLYWPFTEQNLIDVLQERSLRSVTIGRFQRTYFPPGCVVEQISFLRIKHKEKAPLLTINKLVVETSYPRLLTFQWKLETVRVVGLHVMVPAKEPAGEPSPIMPLTYSDSKASMPIAHLYADGAMLDFYRESSPKPLRITVHKLAMQNIDANTAFTYNVQLQNSEPPGTITSQGSFGPWNPSNVNSVPVHGSFNYDNVNLGFYKDLAGTLNANGKFDGNLARINVTGVADVSEFKVVDTSHQRRLLVNYQTAVNATDGDVDLTQVRADFDRTSLLVKGSITGVKDHPGKNVSVDISSGHARLEDFMDLFISGKQAPVMGNANLQLHVDIPANPAAFLTALTAAGSFGIQDGKFADKDTEQSLTRLSDSATKGKPKPPTDMPDDTLVLSNLKGQVTAANGLAHLSHIDFEMPGAEATLDGTFNLLNYRTDMRGTLITKGDISATETGVKSFLLKALTPFLKRENHAKVVPFVVAGPYGNVRISLDLSRKPQANSKP
jgi:hypothetical protein